MIQEIIGKYGNTWKVLCLLDLTSIFQKHLSPENIYEERAHLHVRSIVLVVKPGKGEEGLGFKEKNPLESSHCQCNE